jgi:HTH-type transcriptional regulator/antitoxin HigA
MHKNPAPKSFKPADVFPPGDFIREELDERGWTQGDLARVIGRPLQVVNEIVNGKKRITAQTAKAIGLALGTGPELWINLQSQYDLHSTPEADPQIVQRAARLAKAS